MRYQQVTAGTFLSRPNRFVAQVELPSGVETVHVKNTGRCRELLVPGARVYLARSGNPARKTRFDLIAVEKGARLINMDAQAPNQVFAEWALSGGCWPGAKSLRREVRYGASRLDFCLELPAGPCYVEVKGVTLEEDGRARFPDAPTERGVKHSHELRQAVEQGTAATLFFVVQMADVESVAPNDRTHPAFGEALRQAARAGVQVLAWDCDVTPESIRIRRPVPVILEG